MRWLKMLWLTAALLGQSGESAASGLSGAVIILDPGHGGHDQGTRRRYEQDLISEAQLTWGVTVELKPMLQAAGAKVVTTTTRGQLPADIPMTRLFGQDTIPTKGADAFYVYGQPPITADRAGLATRLQQPPGLTEPEWLSAVYLSLHFDHVMGINGQPPPAGARIIHPAGVYDTLLVECLAAGLSDAGLLRSDDQRPTIANGWRGLGKSLLVLRQKYDPKKYGSRRHRQLVYNHAQRTVLIELANLPSNRDWRNLQTPGALRRLAQAITAGLITYFDLVKSEAPR